MKHVGPVIAALAGSLIVALLQQEIWGWCPFLARRLVRIAARLVPFEHRDRYREEWLAEVEAFEGRNLSMVLFAARILLFAPRMTLALRPEIVRTLVIRAAERVAPAIPPSVLISLWYGISYLSLDAENRYLVPPPHQVIQVAFLDPDNLRELLDALWLSAQVAFLGLAVAMTIGMTLAFVMSQARWLERSVYPLSVIISTIPILAMGSVMEFWFGYSNSTRTGIVVLFAIYPIIANTLFGLQSVDQEHHDLLTLHGATRFTRLRTLQFPAALPSIFTGLRISAGLAVVGAIVSDFFFKHGDPGIGMLIDRYLSKLQTEQMIAAIILSSLLSLVVFWFFGFLGRRVVGRWYESTSSLGK